MKIQEKVTEIEYCLGMPTDPIFMILYGWIYFSGGKVAKVVFNCLYSPNATLFTNLSDQTLKWNPC